MSDDGRVGRGTAMGTTIVVGAILGVLCCAVPLLGVLLFADLAGLFAFGGRLLTLALVGLVAIVGVLLLRSVARARRVSSRAVGGAVGIDDCCPPTDAKQKELTR